MDTTIQTLVTRVAGVEHQIERLNEKLDVLIGLTRLSRASQAPAPTPAQKPVPESPTNSQKKAIGAFLLREHGWQHLARQLALAGYSIPEDLEARLQVIATWALSRHTWAYLQTRMNDE